MKVNDSHGFKVLVVCVAVILVVDSGVRADFTFGKPVNLGPNVNSSSLEANPSISADGLELFFESRRPGGHGPADIYVSRRASKDDPWGPCMNIGAPVNTVYYAQAPSISADGLTLFFSAYNRPGGFGSDDLWVTTRASVSDPWGPPANLGATVNTSSYDWMPSISADGLVLFFMSGRAGGFGGDDLWFTSRPTKNDPWASPVNLGATINSSLNEACPCISADGRMLFFSDHMGAPFRPGGYGGQDIWVTRRATTNDRWGEPTNLGPGINSSDWEFSPNISVDGSTLYFASMPPGGTGNADLWQAPILPVVDFNGDEIVDIKDLVILIEHWGTSDTLCDIGPMPWGDGKVDEKDLEVLMRYWQQEILDPALAAYWKLDEASGMIAADSAGANNGTLVGNPTWQPAGGKRGGALQLDGIDDYVKTPFVVDPAKGPFSVFAWVEGGAPGQVILSQVEAANWLRAAPATGKLQTELNEPGRNATKNLQSPVVITDGTWHRVGLVWDGTSRVLYVDDVEVARGTQAKLPASTAGLYLGADSNLTPGSFWSGLIDDVRIYSRVVKP
jgi:Tol biopolymer transport system component